MTLFAGAAGVASLALLSDAITAERHGEAKQTLEQALSFTAFFVWPSAAFIALFAHPIVQVLFERGAFSRSDTEVTASILMIYAGGVIAFSAHRVLTPALFAWRDPISPMVLTLAGVALKLPLAIGLTHYSPLGLWGIPVAHVLVANLEALALAVALFRKCGRPSLSFWSDNARMLAAMALVSLVVIGLPTQGASLSASLALLGAASVLYVALTHLLGLPYAAQVLSRLRARLQR
jgi:putative peptidoglycan lipid II flippase